MRHSLLFAAALAGSAVANGLEKRAISTQWEIVTVYVTTTIDGFPPVAAATPTPSPGPGVDAAIEVPPPPTLEQYAPEPDPIALQDLPVFNKPEPEHVPVPVVVEQPAPVPVAEPVPAPIEDPMVPAREAATLESYPSDAPNDYARMILENHNKWRVMHGAPPLTWNSDLAVYAEQAAKVCVFAHNTNPGGGGYGQNIAASSESDDVASLISNLFYKNELPIFAPYFGLPDPPKDSFSAWGHLTQLLWKDTTECGCATYDCTGRMGGLNFFTICNYKNQGNVAGGYAENVLPALETYA